MGCKRVLLPRILTKILSAAGRPESFLDGFFGTGVVTAGMRRSRPARIVAVDNLFSNAVILRGFLLSRDHGPGMAGILEHLNRQAPRDGYITAHYGDRYFTMDNCRRMDGIREEIEALRRRGGISDGEHDYCLAGFLLEADRVANTLGQYDAYLKNLGHRSVENGRHLLDSRVYSPFRLRPLELLESGETQVITGDLLELLPRLRGFRIEVAYFDPPYNTRQYCDNYHVLENLARWEKPALQGKTRKFPRQSLKSPFSRRTAVREAFQRLLSGCPSPHLFLSYNSEGLLVREELEGILSAHGKLERTDFAYSVFGNGAGVSRKRTVTEYLFHLERC